MENINNTTNSTTEVEAAIVTNEENSTISINLGRIFEVAFYGIGAILIILSLTYFFNDLEARSSGDIYEFREKTYVGGDAYNFIISAARSSAVMTKGLILAVLGCSSIIVGRLTAITNMLRK